ncbi:hypothetical protein MNBD_GAMMA12-2946 [hydrothermal vent metagenome]|uniref:Uncharacterized protein n=1 Tax=hydrothermal vent metagenome TaxID=652676 RepID=A0A3B0Z2W7_9ZZZZ
MFNIFRSKLLLIIAGISLTVAGIIGPTVFIDTMGELNLFQLTEMMDALKSLGLPLESTNMYFWIGVVFISLITLSLIATLYRMYISVWLLAVSGVAIWGVSYYYYYEWHTKALKAVSAGVADGGVLATAVKTLHLQWGAWCILGGLLLIVSATMLRKK